MSRLYRSLLCLVSLHMVGCSVAPEKLDPTITYTPPLHQWNKLPSAFPPLSREERETSWGKELFIGDIFAKEGDYYRAITCYKRAQVLIPDIEQERALQIAQGLITCYYLGQKYQEAVDVFESSPLTHATPHYAGWQSLLLMLYHAYVELGYESRAEVLLQKINKCSPETAADLILFRDLKKGDLNYIYPNVDGNSCADPYIEEIRHSFAPYRAQAKSPHVARALNALLPGMGYFYIGQRKTAFTSFVINALFSAAAYQFFHRGYTAAGVITTGFEAGWYFGGINGAGLGAQQFNDRLYEGVAKKILLERQCFPILMWETTF